jgi:signal transduction histidine kinase
MKHPLQPVEKMKRPGPIRIPDFRLPAWVHRTLRKEEAGTFLLILVILTGIFVFDARTPQSLVASILLDIPIALTGLVLRPGLTFLVVMLSLVANVMAGIIDARTEGTVNSIAVANRFFTTVSLILVGYLTLSIQKKAHLQGLVESERIRFSREAKIRELFAQVNQTAEPDVFLQQLSSHLQRLLLARGIILAFSDGESWKSRPFAIPSSLWFWPEGDPLPGYLALQSGRPFSPSPMDPVSLSPLTDANNVSGGIVGRLTLQPRMPGGDRLWPHLYLFVLEPSEPEAAAILREIIPAMESALLRAALLSDLRKTNDTLINRNRLVEDLIRGVSHDIRTPLIAADLTLDLVRKGVFGVPPNELGEALDQLRQSNGALLDLANHLLFLSRAETEGFPATADPVDISLLSDEVLQSLEPLIQKKHLRMDNALAPAVVRGDRPSLRRLLVNLVDNAIKYSPNGESIQVCCQTMEEKVMISVRDNGSGIPEDIRAGLFERFRKEKDGSGFGLGLYIAQQIARQHRGEIQCLCHPVGTEFRVTLPAIGAS